MEALLLKIISSPLFWQLAGGLLAVLYIYTKGYSKGRAAEVSRQSKEKEELEERIRKAEAENQKTERETHEDLDEVAGSGTIDELLELWKRGRNKAKGTNAYEKSKD